VEISFNTKTRLPRCPWSLVFVLKLISTFIGQNPKFFFMIVLKKDVLLLSPQPVRSKFLKSIPFKVVLS
jgi:hypothetical protein